MTYKVIGKVVIDWERWQMWQTAFNKRHINSRMPTEPKQKKIDIRLVLLENSEEYQDLEKIREITQVDDYKAILKSCIKVAYSHYYEKIGKNVAGT